MGPISRKWLALLIALFVLAFMTPAGAQTYNLAAGFILTNAGGNTTVVAANPAAARTLTFQDVGTSTGNVVLARTGPAPTAAAGTNAGASPPAPVVATGTSDTRGTITWGTGTGPAIGAQAVVTFGAAFAVAPSVVVLNPNNITTAGAGVGQCQAYVSAITTTTFTISCVVAPAASQANTVYSASYWVQP